MCSMHYIFGPSSRFLLPSTFNELFPRASRQDAQQGYGVAYQKNQATFPFSVSMHKSLIRRQAVVSTLSAR